MSETVRAMAKLVNTSRTLGRLLAGSLLLPLASPLAADDLAPQRVGDLDYGTVLYEYYQGNAFEALSRLNVAKVRGGIQGHGDHPALVEGGLMLAYGMTREARALFERLLDDSAGQEAVGPKTRSQAWFYLGKVFYLEQDHDAARSAMARVEPEVLKQEDSQLYHEWLYLGGQLALQSGNDDIARPLADLPADSPWRAYLIYNRAVHWLGQGRIEAAADALTGLAGDLEKLAVAADDAEADELGALRERVQLSLGKLHLQQGAFAEAMASLKSIPIDGVLSDQAMFDYAIAASQQGDLGLALRALNILRERPLFTPWLQQVPYARGFLYEQMGEPARALHAYRDAADHYQALESQLAREQQQLTEARVVAALSLGRQAYGGEYTTDSAGNGQVPGTASVTTGATDIMTVSLGDSTVANDTYGRIDVSPGDYSLSELLATEPFQLALRDLHELYRLQRSLATWERQLPSFEVMLDTRARRRATRIAETRQALTTQQADQWRARQAAYRAQVDRATASEDHRFFMTDEQKAFDRQIRGVLDTLERLPDDDSTAKQRRKIDRIRAYFDWWIADEYAVNRWAAEKQLRELEQAMATFVSQRQVIEREMASDDRHDAFASRIDIQQQRLDALRGELDKALAAARQDLVARVNQELQRQRQQVGGYLRAARHAQARLADDLFLGQGPGVTRNKAPAGPEAGRQVDQRANTGEGSRD